MLSSGWSVASAAVMRSRAAAWMTGSSSLIDVLGVVRPPTTFPQPQPRDEGAQEEDSAGGEREHQVVGGIPEERRDRGDHDEPAAHRDGRPVAPDPAREHVHDPDEDRRG